MSPKSVCRRATLFWLAATIILLACSVSGTAPNSEPSFDSTKAALLLQATSMSLQLTQAALNNQPRATQPPATQPPVQAPPQAVVTQPPVVVPSQIPVTPTQNVEAQIKNAKILVYENTDERGIGMWVQDALDGMGLTYTQTGSYSGHFMEYLNSGIKYDLIIVDAEDKDRISGEFWDVINTRLARDKAAMIAEVWYLQSEANGPIAKILGGCGIRYRKAYDTVQSVYWWESTHPVFNEPNTVLPLLHYSQYWANGAGDEIMLGGSGDAIMLAGLSSSKGAEGAIASCYQGRVIIQTFSDHDFHHEDIIALWQNYIHYTLKNHFAAIQ